MNRWELEKKIAIKAIKDPLFRKRLISDPVKAIHEINKSFKFDKIHVKVLEEKQNEWILPLPSLNKEHQNLSEIELEKIFAATCLLSWSEGNCH